MTDRKKFEELNQELQDIKKNAAIKDKLKKMLSQAQNKRVQERKNLQVLEKVLSKEEKDVDRLEKGPGLTALLAAILGTKKDKVNKEKQEAVAARFKYETSKASLQSIEDEIRHLESEIEKIGDIETRYHEIIEQKEKSIQEKGDREYITLLERVSGLKAEAQQFEQAVSSGSDVLAELERLTGFLKNVSGWGDQDMPDGEKAAKEAKYSNMDDAKQAVIQIQQLLRHFQHELTDMELDPGSKLDAQIDTFSRFADFFFENLVYDWAVQSKIDRSLRNVQETRKRVGEIVEKLKGRLAALRTEIQETENEKKQRVERA